MSSRGFLYAATGEKWVREAAMSATQLGRVHPEIPSVLFTDKPDLAAGGPFDEVITVPEQRWVRTEVKLWSVARTPFDRTVFLDTDTFVCGDVSELFVVLDRVDFAGVAVPLRLAKGPAHVDPPDIPDAFQSINGGMFAYRRNEATSELFETWWQLYQADMLTARAERIMDQPSLRVALWRSKCELLLLPPEYNMRTLQYRARPTVAVGPVRIIHGRPQDFEALARRWNRNGDPRLLTPLLQYQLRLAWRKVPRGFVPRRLLDATGPMRRRLTGDG